MSNYPDTREGVILVLAENTTVNPLATKVEAVPDQEVPGAWLVKVHETTGVPTFYLVYVGSHPDAGAAEEVEDTTGLGLDRYFA